MLGQTENRKARFRTVIALIFEKKEYLFEGIVNGTIISEKRGTEGFGYDPVFIPEGKTRHLQKWNLLKKTAFHTGQEHLKN